MLPTIQGRFATREEGLLVWKSRISEITSVTEKYVDPLGGSPTVGHIDVLSINLTNQVLLY